MLQAEMFPNFLQILILLFTVGSIVFNQRRAPSPLVLSQRMQLAPGSCEVDVYLPVCGHPGFMATI